MNFPIELLKKHLEEGGIEMPQGAAERFEAYGNYLVEENEKMNLTAITEPYEVVIKHFLDSALLLKYLPETSFKIADVGTGAGFPGMVLKILRPDIDLFMFDGLNKRVEFLKRLSDLLKLDTTAVHIRAEDAGRNNDYREAFDVVTARAVANMNTLSEYCLPLAKKGGVFVAMKGPAAFDEAENAKKALSVLGGGEAVIKTETLPENDTRCFVIVKKISQTPPKYPRNSGKISKQPL